MPPKIELPIAIGAAQEQLGASAAHSLALEALLDHLPKQMILARYESAGGKEISSGKFANPASSAALVANVFGFFLETPHLLSLPLDLEWDAVATSVTLEAELRFPWTGGRHPWLDVLVDSGSQLIAIEAKRYEPFRDSKRPEFSSKYFHPVWGSTMGPYERLRDNLASGKIHFEYLDAAQLVKHAFGLRTQAVKNGKKATLIYLYAEPKKYPSGEAVNSAQIEQHRHEVARFRAAIAGNPCDVSFHAIRYIDLLEVWARSTNDPVREHAAALLKRFDGYAW